MAKNAHFFTYSILKKKSRLFRDDVCCTKRLEADMAEMRVGVMVTHSTNRAKLKKNALCLCTFKLLLLSEFTNLFFYRIINSNHRKMLSEVQHAE